MILILQTMRIGKMSTCTPKLCSKRIHHFHEFISCSSYMFCNGRSCIISRIDKQAMKKLIHCDLISCLKTCHLRT